MKHFKAYELVDEEVYNKFGENSIKRFFDPRLLEILIFIREGIGKPMIINTWYEDGAFSQRGLRTNVSPMVKRKTHLYLSAHCLGKAVDFHINGMSPDEIRAWIINHKADLPYNIRLEKDVNWVHIDVATYKDTKIDIF